MTHVRRHHEHYRHYHTRGRPYGEAEWILKTAAKFGLEHTLRGPGRPKNETGGTGESQ